MSSVATQTEWSWLKDWEEISRLSRERGVELSRVKFNQSPEEGCRLHPDSGDGGVEQESPTACHEALPVENTNSTNDGATGISETICNINKEESSEKLIRDENERSQMIDDETDNRKKNVKASEKKVSECTHEALTLPAIGNHVTERDNCTTDAKELTLPPIVSVSEKVEEKSLEELNDVIKTAESSDVSVSSLEQLEQLTFPFLEAQQAERSSVSKEESSSNDEEEEEEGRDASEKSGTEVSAPSLKLDNLPWPTILQYVRESESLASEYFSIDNKEAVESRMAQNKKLLHQPKSDTSRGDSSRKHKPGSHIKEEGELDSSSESTVNSTEKEEGSEKCHICDFCGQNSPEVSLLQLAEDKEARGAVCCEGKKEFCVLIAVCMKQMIKQLQQQKPKKISVQLTKNIVTKNAEERALALMRRQRKWEELRKKKDEIQQQGGTMKMSKHTQLIQFSLLSSEITEGGWIVRPGSSTKYQTPKRQQDALKKERAGKKREDRLKKGVLLPKTVERLKQCGQSQGELEVLKYSDGSKFGVMLPDGTGHLYYHSGNMAVISFSPYSGVLAYLLFEDSSQPCILAYADQLGRITCYNNDGKIRLLLRPTEGVLYEGESCQSCKKRWRWKDTDIPEMQPFTISLNKQISVKILSHERFLLVFSGSKQNHMKFEIESKLNKEDILITRDREKDQLVQNHLLLVKNRISQLLQLLKQNSRPNVVARKHSMTEGSTIPPAAGWQSIYSTKTRLKGDASLHTHRGGRFPGQRRTKSTGELTLHKSPLKVKPLT